MRIRLSALDTLFFRDGKPFDRGEETWADGIFPPPSSMLYGALRSLYFVQHPEHIGKENTESDPTRHLIINDVQITSSDNLYFPCPSDIVLKKNTLKEEDNLILLSLEKNSSITSSDLEYRLAVENNEEVETLSDFISERSLKRYYLKGGKPKGVFPLEQFRTLEPKVGIGRDNSTHVSDDGLLYRVGMIRPQAIDEATNETYSLNIEVDFELEGWSLNEGESGFVKLGGEGKSCSYKVIPNKKDYFLKTLSSDVLKIYFISPTFFNNEANQKVKSWLPSFLNLNSDGEWVGEWDGIKLKFLTAALGKPKYVGGFDIKKRRPKPMVKMIPEGAVFYFQLLNEADKKRIKNMPQPIKFMDKNEALEKQGFGLAYIANVIK